MIQSKSKQVGSPRQAEGTGGSAVCSKTNEASSALCVDSQMSHKG